MKLLKLLFLVIYLVVPSAHAALVTLSTTDFDLTYDDTMLGRFGPPQLSNNVIFFTPIDFSTASANGQGVTFTNSTINLMLQPRPGFTFASITYEERGDYYLSGEGASVEVTGQIRVRNMDDVLSESTAFISSEETLDQQGINNWTASAFIDGTTGDWQPSASGIILTIQNLLIARTESLGELAFIEKKFLGGSFDIQSTTVPLPGAFILMLSAIGCGGLLLRSKARSSLPT
jgi:hypothetical protein